jgi:ABC-type transport system involved in cytochrome c biogenesis permease subunit
LIFALYVLTGIFYWREFQSQRISDRRVGGILFSVTLLSHLGYFVYLTVELGRLPIGTVSEALGTFVLMTAIVYFLLERRLRERSMGAFILPIFALLLLVSILTFQRTEGLEAILYDVRFEIHVINMLLGNGAFVLSFIASLLYLMLAKELKKPDHSVFFRRLPSLPFFERISDAAVDLGLVFTTIGFILGSYVASQVWSLAFWVDPKILAVILTWLIYMVHFLSRKFAGWRGRRAAIVSLVGFGWVLFSFLFVSTMISNLHQFK